MSLKSETRKSQFEEYHQISTIHGIGHFGRAPKIAWKIFWFLVILFCTLALSVQLVILIIRYNNYEKRLNLDLRFGDNPFPAVSVCSLNPFKNSEARKVESIATMLASFDAALKSSKNQPPSTQQFRSKVTKNRHTLCLCDATTCKEMNLEGDSHPSIEPLHVRECMCSSISCIACDLQDGCPDEHGTIIRKKRQIKDYETRVTVCNCAPQGSCSSNLNFADGIDYTSQLNPCICASLDGEEQFCNLCEDLNDCKLIIPEPETTPNPTTTTTTKKTTTTTRSTTKLTTPTTTTTKKTTTTTTTTTTITTTTPTTTTTTTKAPLAPDNPYGFEAGSDSIAVQAIAQESLPFLTADLDQETKSKITLNASELIKNCAFNAKSCDIERDFVKVLDPKYGSCFTFNYLRPVRFESSRAGPLYGLRLVLFSNTSDYMRTTETAGARVVIHDQMQHSFPDAFGFNAPTGTASSFAVRSYRTDRLEPPYGKCRKDSSSLPYYYQGKFTIEGCTRSCYQRAVIRRCGCGDPRFDLPVDVNFKELNITNLELYDIFDIFDNDTSLLDTENNTLVAISHCKSNNTVAKKCLQSFKDEAVRDLDCDCPMPCEENTFQVTVSASKWPYNIEQVPGCEGEEASNSECSEMTKSGIMIEVFYEQLSYEYRWETPAYSVINLLSDMAGQVGFWVGVSMISIIEVFVWFCSCCCSWCCKEDRKKNSVDSHNDLSSIESLKINAKRLKGRRPQSNILVRSSTKSEQNDISALRLPPLNVK